MSTQLASATQIGFKSEPVAQNGAGPESDAQQWLRMPAHELSKAIKSGRLTCTRLCQLCIERIKLVQPAINGMAQDRFEAALREARELDDLLVRFNEENSGDPPEKQTSRLTQEQRDLLESPLLGVPVTVKESIGIKGMRNSAGSWQWRDRLAEDDAVVIKNIKRHGMIPICTSNIPELTLFWADCQNLVYGRSRNPYDTARITGASSGGEGTLLGSGASVLGIGSDIGGSLRIPAHYCGVSSHKPSPFLVSSEGNFPALKESRLRLFTLGPMARYASDLRYLLKLLLSDKENSLQDTYRVYQPRDISEGRARVIAQLENVSEFSDLSGVKLLYCNFKQTSRLSAMVGMREVRVQRELMEAQREVLEHFAAKFGCTLELIDLDRYMDNIYVIWQAMIACGGTITRDKEFEPHEITRMYGIDSIPSELVKYCMGLSKHTKEGIMSLIFGYPISNERQRAYKECEQLEKLAAEMKAEIEQAMGELGCVVMPTLPTMAHKHHFSLMRTYELRFPSLWNVVQMPATHVTLRVDKKRGLPYGLTIASRPFNDALTISIAEEIERTFGGWTPPPKLANVKSIISKSAH